MDEIGEGGLSAIALQERLECADKTRRMAMHGGRKCAL